MYSVLLLFFWQQSLIYIDWPQTHSNLTASAPGLKACTDMHHRPRPRCLFFNLYGCASYELCAPVSMAA